MQATQTPTQPRFFIRDCHGNVVGNKSGYRTMRGAMQQAESKYSIIHKILWRTFYYWVEDNPDAYERLVYSIKTNEL